MITFKSRAAASVLMFDEIAFGLLKIIGRDPARQGILTVEQLPEAIETLQRAALADRAQSREREAALRDEDEDAPRPSAPTITLSARTVPLIEMLSLALKAQQPVIWEG